MVLGNSVYFAGSHRSPSKHHEEAEAACIANISPLERRKRLSFGIIQLIATLVILGILLALDVNPLWRLPLLFMFWAAAVGYFQAHDKT